jgi:dynein heavy chain
MFGLHPNAEIGFLTSTANELFSTIVSLSGGTGGSDAGGGAGTVGAVMDDILTRLPKGFDEHDIADRSKVRAPAALPSCRRAN